MLGISVSRMGSVRICEDCDGSHSYPFNLSILEEDVDIYNYGEHMDSNTVTRVTNSIISVKFRCILLAIADALVFIKHLLSFEIPLRLYCVSH